MKTLLFLPALFAAAAIARADLVIEQNIQSPFVTGVMYLKVKGDMVRTDIPSQVGAMSVIVDLKSGKSTTLIPSQKMAMKMDASEIGKEVTDAKAAGKPILDKPKPTGVTEKVGEWNAQVYQATSHGIPLKIWAAKDFPNAQAIKDRMNAAMKAASNGTYDPADTDVPGMIVKTEMDTPQGKVVSQLVSVKEESLSDTEFTVPSDYKVMDMPKNPGAGAAPSDAGVPAEKTEDVDAPEPAPEPAPVPAATPAPKKKDSKASKKNK